MAHRKLALSCANGGKQFHELEEGAAMCVRQLSFVLAVFGALFSASLSAQVPDAPSDLTAQASRPGDLAISLFWNDNSTNETIFEIERSIGEGNTVFEALATRDFNISSLNDVGLLENTTYNYRVRAQNAQGNSAYSNVASAKTSYAMPIQVDNLVGTVQDGDVHLSWTDMADNETFFAVERAENGVSVAYETIASLPPDSNSYVDRTALDGASYSYRVRPWRFDVSGGAPLTVDLQTGPALAALRSVAAKAKSRTAIEITWRGEFARSSRVQVQGFNLDTGFWETLGQVRASDKKFIDSGLQPRTTYAYRLRLVTPTAVSVWSEVTATTR